MVIVNDKFSSIFGEIRANAASQLLNAAVQCPNDIVHYTRDYQWREKKRAIFVLKTKRSDWSTAMMLAIVVHHIQMKRNISAKGVATR